MLYKRFFIVFGVVLVLSSFTFSLALAEPPTPYSGSSTATGISSTLILSDTTGAIEANVLLGSQQGAITGTGTVVSTSGRGNGLEVAEASPLLDAGADFVNAASFADTATPGPDSDTDFVAAAESTLVDTALLSTTTTSEVAATFGTVGVGEANDVSVFADVAGTQPFVAAGSITENIQLETTSGMDALSNVAIVRLEDVTGTLAATVLTITARGPIGLATFLTADSITASASATCDGTTGGTTADASVDFINLNIQGQDFSAAPPNTVVPITIGGTTVAEVTLSPVMTSTVAGTTSLAEAVALRIETVADIAGLASGTVVNLGTATAECTAVEESPTSVTVQTLGAEASGSGGLLAALPLALLGSVFAVAARHHRRRARPTAGISGDRP